MDINALPAAPLPVQAQLPATPKGQRPDAAAAARVKKVSQDFEAMFVGLMLKSMRDTVGKDKLTGGGHGEETFRTMLDQEYASSASRSGGLGLAKMVERELTRSGAAPAAPKGAGRAD